MAKQLFLNNVETTFLTAVKDTPVTGSPATELGYGILQVNTSTSAALTALTGGDYYVMTALKRAGSVESTLEIMRVTAVDTLTFPGECRLTVLRAQEGTTAKAYLAGDYLSLRLTKGALDGIFATLAEDSGSGSIGHIGTGTGATATTVQAKLRKILHVTDKGAVVDNTTDDTAAVIAAVADAYASGAILVWPPGICLTTASIPYFHSVRHAGAGAIRRGSNIFYVEPSPYASTTNNLYVATSGDNANDGLSSSQPMATPKYAGEVLINYGPTLCGFWVVNLAAGTYTPAQQGIYLRGLRSVNLLVFAGPSVGGSPNVPTAILDGVSASAGYGVGAFFGHGMRVQLQDIKFYRWGSAGSEGGIDIETGTYLYLKNVHVETAYYYCVRAFSGYLYVDGGIYKTTSYYGILAQDCQYSVGYNGSAGANRVSVIGCDTGVYVVGSSDGHVQFTDITGTHSKSVWLNDGARCQMDGNTASGATVADVYADGGSSFCEGSSSTWGSTTPYLLLGAATKENDSLFQSLGYRVVTAAQVDKTSSASSTTILTSPTLTPGTYFFEAEGDGTAGAGGFYLNISGSLTVSYLRSSGLLLNGATIVDARQDTATSGIPATNSCAYTGAFTHFRVTGTIVVATSGVLRVRFAQNVSNAATTSVYQGAILRVLRVA